MGRIGQGHQIRQKRRLQVRVIEHHAGMPIKFGILVDEDSVQSRDGRGQAGQAEVERPDADRQEIVDSLRGAHVS